MKVIITNNIILHFQQFLRFLTASNRMWFFFFFADMQSLLGVYTGTARRWTIRLRRPFPAAILPPTIVWLYTWRLHYSATFYPLYPTKRGPFAGVEPPGIHSKPTGSGALWIPTSGLSPKTRLPFWRIWRGRPAGRAQQAYVYREMILHLLSLFLAPPLIHATRQTEGRKRMSEEPWPKIIAVKWPCIASKRRYGRVMVE